MRFAQPEFLWFSLVLLPVLCAFLFWAWRARQKLTQQFIQARLLAQLTVGVSPKRQKFRLILLVASVALLLLAIARPQWGFNWEEARQQGLDIVVAIDTSKSMLAADVTPDRLTRAKFAALDLMKLAGSDRLGLVAFAGSAFLQSPLTSDEEAFRQNVQALNTEIIPHGGTAIAEAIQAAQSAFTRDNDNYQILVLFTDGEDHDEGALAAAEAAAKDGMRIFTIGVGSAEGELIRIRQADGSTTFLKDDQGNVVKSRLNETLLQQIATAASGFYLPLRGANPMETLYTRGLAPLPKAEAAATLIKTFRERFHWPLGLAIALLILEVFLPQQKKVRRAEPEAAMDPAGGATANAAAVALLALLLPLAVAASPSSALRNYEAGDFEAALREYERLLQQRTNDHRLHFNAGTSAYQAGEFDTAKQHFEGALLSPDLKLQEDGYYNLGNTLYQLGESTPEANIKKGLWEQALKNYDNALRLNATNLHATNNLQFVKRRIEELKQEEQQKQDAPPEDVQPSDEAKKAKAEADEAVRQRNYKQALEIMENQLKRDPTANYYADYIQRLKEINGVSDSDTR